MVLAGDANVVPFARGIWTLNKTLMAPTAMSYNFSAYFG